MGLLSPATTATLNKLRADDARHALAHSMAAVQREPLDTQVIDLLSNLRHLCAAEGLSFDTLDAHAAQHYVVEGGPLHIEAAPEVKPLTHCPKCGEEDLLVLAERAYSLDGSQADDGGEQVAAAGKLYCASGCGELKGDAADATVEACARGVR